MIRKLKIRRSSETQGSDRKYREISSEGYAYLARTSMKGADESIEDAKQNMTFLKGVALATESGKLQDKIAKIISEL